MDSFYCSWVGAAVSLRGVLRAHAAIASLGLSLAGWLVHGSGKTHPYNVAFRSSLNANTGEAHVQENFCLVVICSIMMVTGGRFELAANTTAKEDAHTEKVKQQLQKLGTGPSAQIEIKLRDKSKLEGYIKEANEDHFVLVSSATGSATEVAYPQVKQVKGNNFSTGAKVAIGVGIGIAILLLVFKDHIIAY